MHALYFSIQHNVNSPHLIGWLGDGGRVLRLQGRGLSVPIGLHHLRWAIRRRLLHDGHALQQGRPLESRAHDEDTKACSLVGLTPPPVV